MVRTTKKRRVITISIPEEFYPTLSAFKKLIKMDPRINRDDPKVVPKKGKVFGVKIRDLIKQYVNAHGSKLLQKEGVEQETQEYQNIESGTSDQEKDGD